MKNRWLLHAAIALVLVVLAIWIARHTTWIEVEEDGSLRGAAAHDPYYALRAILRATGSPFEVRTSLDPLPPVDATLVLDSRFWDIFPERDAQLEAWVAAGGRLVIASTAFHRENSLRWLPLVNRPTRLTPAVPASAAASAASAPGDDENDADAPAPPPPAQHAARPFPPRPGAARDQAGDCHATRPLTQTIPATAPPRTRLVDRCLAGLPVRAVRGAEKTWELDRTDGRPFAIRVAFGRGSVTGVGISDMSPLRETGLLKGDAALVFSDAFDARPGRPVWLVTDEAGERMPRWLWHHARAPLLLAVAAVALGLWRLLVRFGPREAPPATARRSMGEQVRGTGAFIAATDPAALHAATRHAFDAAARTRLEDYDRLSDAERVRALAGLRTSAAAIAPAALLAALAPTPRANAARWLDAVAVIEQARRALLRGAPPS